MGPLLTLSGTFNKGRKKKKMYTVQDKLKVAIFVIVDGDRSTYFTIFKLATVNEIYEMIHILATRRCLHCTDL